MALYIGNKKYCAIQKSNVNNKDILITENGDYVVEDGYTGFGVVRVKIPDVILDELVVEPKVTAQTLTSLHDGFSTVTVNPVTSNIDSDIIPANIKKGVDILGVAGTLEFTTETLLITPTTTTQIKTPTMDGYSKVTVNPVTADIDANITAGNILKDVTILGVTGTAIEANETTRNITANGTYDAPYTGFSQVVVDVKVTHDALDITPSTTLQTFTAVDDYHGFSPVTVKAVTADIDPNIIATNIREGVTILGVEGNIGFEETTINPSTLLQEITPTKDGFSKVTVNPVTAAIDADIKPGNILEGVEILGVTGTIGFEERTVNPTTSQQILTPLKNGFSKVTVNAVTSAIDANIIPGNIKSGVEILGVTGIVVELTGQERTETLTSTTGAVYTPEDGYNAITSIQVTPNNKPLSITPTTYAQTHTVPAGYSGHGDVTVGAVTNTIDSNIVAGNIKSGVTILGVTGTLTELKGQTKTITANGTYTPDTGYTGFTSVTVNVDTVNNQDKTITANGIYTPDEGYTGFGTVTVDINTVNNTDITITTNGTYTPSAPYTGFGTVKVDVSSKLSTLSVTPKTTAQTLTPAAGMLGFNKVNVSAVTSAIDSNIKAENIKQGVTILGVTGTAIPATLQTKTITDVGTFYPDAGYSGFSSVTVDMAWVEEALQALNAGDVSTTVELQEKTVTQAGTYTPDSGFDGFSKIIVDLSWVEAEIERIAQGYTTTSADTIMSATSTQINTSAAYIRDYACYYMTSLTDVNLVNATRIGQYAFGNSGLQTLTLNASTVCTLDSINAFEGITLTAIYVPDSLVNSYKTATNWTTYASVIKGISTKV